MKEIKFKVWDKKFSKMQIVRGVTFYNFGDLESITTDNTYFHKINENFELTQFTGLKDKNGKEIYEGDIVIVYEYLNGKIWKGHLHYAEIKFIKGMFDIDPAWCHQSLQSNEVEVVGNIYENPELLKKDFLTAL